MESNNEIFTNNLVDISLNRKKLKEAETQVKSLTLILEQATTAEAHVGLNVVALGQSKVVLEREILEIKEYISKKELEIVQENNNRPKDEEFMERSSSKRKDEVDANHDFLGLDETECGQTFRKETSQNEKGLCGSSSEANALSVGEWMDTSGSSDRSSLDDLGMIASEDKSFIDYLRKENGRLRQQLGEARQRHKVERNNIIENLRVLEMETMNNERKWENEAEMKELKIAELINQNQELKAKNNELISALENGESVKVEKEKVEDDLNDVQRKLNEAKETVNELKESEVELKRQLCEKSQTVEEKKRELEKCSEEIEQMRSNMDSLQNKVNSLGEVKDNLEEQLKTLTNNSEIEIARVETEFRNKEKLLQEKLDEASQNTNNFRQTKADLENQMKINKELEVKLSERKSQVKCLEGDEVQNKKEVMELQQKILQKESTIQELTISLGNAIKERSGKTTSVNGDHVVENTSSSLLKGKLSNNIKEMMTKVSSELMVVQKDVTRHKESVEILGDKWRNYKKCVQEIHQGLQKES